MIFAKMVETASTITLIICKKKLFNTAHNAFIFIFGIRWFWGFAHVFVQYFYSKMVRNGYLILVLERGESLYESAHHGNATRLSYHFLLQMLDVFLNNPMRYNPF